jgi:hypothetical protein
MEWFRSPSTRNLGAVTRSAVPVAGFKLLSFRRVQRPSTYGSWSIVSGVTGISHG